MDLHCRLFPFKRVLQTRMQAAAGLLRCCCIACFLSSHDLGFGSLIATRDPPVSPAQCQHFSSSGHVATELSIDSDMAYRLCQSMTLQRLALRPSVNRLPMYCSSVRKIFGRNEMQQRNEVLISVIPSLRESNGLLLSHQ